MADETNDKPIVHPFVWSFGRWMLFVIVGFMFCNGILNIFPGPDISSWWQFWTWFG